jgi:leucyl-tRNA synthetase
VVSATAKSDGRPVTYEGWTTMSKSKNNGVDPQDLIEKYGADTARLYTMFTAPPEATLEWNDAALEGSYRFLRRVWNFGHKLGAGSDAGVARATGKQAKALRREIHTILRQVDYDYQRMQYNTVVSGAMKLLNALEDFKGGDIAPTLGAKAPALPPGGLASRGGPAPLESGADAAVREGFGILLRVLYPVTPHIAQELWGALGYSMSHGDLLDSPWPRIDEQALLQDEVQLVLQINGKHRGSVTVPAAASLQEIERLAIASEDFAKHAGGAVPRKVIVVAGRLVNVVV